MVSASGATRAPSVPDAPRVALTTAPKTATPTALPAERKNMFRPVTTPRSCHCTADWAAMSVGAAVKPMPRPMTNAVAPTWTTLEDPSSRSSSAEPRSTTLAPTSAVDRMPTRR